MGIHWGGGEREGGRERGRGMEGERERAVEAGREREREGGREREREGEGGER